MNSVPYLHLGSSFLLLGMTHSVSQYGSFILWQTEETYFVFFGSEFLNIYLLLSEELLAFQEGVCIMKLGTYYIFILEIYYCLCHDPACEDIIAVFLAKSNM
jgi:hypothetical protein